MKTVKLNNGVEMPILGYGVFQITDAAECEQAVYDALMTGYRLIDTAKTYGNFHPDRVMDFICNHKIVPAVNQIELHPFFQQTETSNFLTQNSYTR